MLVTKDLFQQKPNCIDVGTYYDSYYLLQDGRLRGNGYGDHVVEEGNYLGCGYSKMIVMDGNQTDFLNFDSPCPSYPIDPDPLT